MEITQKNLRVHIPEQEEVGEELHLYSPVQYQRDRLMSLEAPGGMHMTMGVGEEEQAAQLCFFL